MRLEHRGRGDQHRRAARPAGRRRGPRRASCATPARSPSPPPRSTPAPPRSAAPGTPGSRRSSSTRCCAPRPTRRVLSRASALGWGAHGDVAVVLGARAPAPGRARRLRVRTPLGARRRHGRALRHPGRPARRRPRRRHRPAQGRDPPCSTTSATARSWSGPSPPTWPRPSASARAALSAHRAASGWPDAPRPVASRDLLPERALAGDGHARRHLVDEVYLPLLAAARHPDRDARRRTSSTGSSIEGTARALFVHPNTVRYRLRQVAELTGWSPTDAHARRSPSQLALILGSPVAVAQQLCRNPTKITGRVSCGAGRAVRRPRPRQSGDVLVIVAPGQGAQTPGFLTPWLEDPTFAVALRLAVHRRRPRPRPLRHRGRRRHDPRHQDRPAAAGRHRPGRRPRAVPAPGRRVRAASAPSPATASASSPPPTGARVITAEQAMVLVRERGNAMAEAAATTADRHDRRPRRRPRRGPRRARDARPDRRQRQRPRPDRRRRHHRAARRPSPTTRRPRRG